MAYEDNIINNLFDFCLSLNATENIDGILKKLHKFVSNRLSIKFSGIFLEKGRRIFLYPECIENNYRSYNSFFNKIKKANKSVFINIDGKNSFLTEIEKRNQLTNLFILPLNDKKDFLGFLFFYGNKDLIIKSTVIKEIKLVSVYLAILLSKKKLSEIMEQRVAELFALQIVNKFVSSTLDFKKLINITLDALVGLIGLRTCSITIFTDKLLEDIYSRKQRALIVSVDMSSNIEIDLNKGIYCELAKKRSLISGFTEFKGDFINLFPNEKVADDTRFQYVILPIIKGQELLGSINIFDPTLEHIKNIQNNFLESFANQFSIALQNAQLYKKLENMANKDGLTSLYNHAFFQNKLNIVIKERSKRPLSLIFIDIDDFKQINDKYGHLVGDSVLKELANVLRHNIRDGDLVARYGGEEFAIILPGTREDKARIIANRLREKVADHKMNFANSNSFHITISIGLAIYQLGWTKEDFINQADKALYSAKENGKNRVVFTS